MSGTKQGIFLSLIFVISSITIPQYVFAYRPFISTDAEVADKKVWEVELGLFNISHDEGKNELTIPSLRINYGIFKNWEAVGEFDTQVYGEGEGVDFEIKDPAVFLKGVLYDGILQNRQGSSFAIELGVLLPSTVEKERNAGLEGLALLSGKIHDLLYHLNAGAELDREDFAPNGIWGMIHEYPFGGKLRAVGEVTGIVKSHGSPDNSGLIGFILEILGTDLDFGVRKGLSNAASDWELTTGITFSF
ncbi:MAG TPA: hypothetical protein ACFYD6_02160 [Candidatus Brocadiia bacterium]|nr:hypothetical protein [Candidatus Brocadiales bacterium]